jgi:hypothetical protein
MKLQDLDIIAPQGNDLLRSLLSFAPADLQRGYSMQEVESAGEIQVAKQMLAAPGMLVFELLLVDDTQMRLEINAELEEEVEQEQDARDERVAGEISPPGGEAAMLMDETTNAPGAPATDSAAEKAVLPAEQAAVQPTTTAAKFGGRDAVVAAKEDPPTKRRKTAEEASAQVAHMMTEEKATGEGEGGGSGGGRDCGDGGGGGCAEQRITQHGVSGTPTITRPARTSALSLTSNSEEECELNSISLGAGRNESGREEEARSLGAQSAVPAAAPDCGGAAVTPRHSPSASAGSATSAGSNGPPRQLAVLEGLGDSSGDESDYSCDSDNELDSADSGKGGTSLVDPTPQILHSVQRLSEAAPRRAAVANPEAVRRASGQGGTAVHPKQMDVAQNLFKRIQKKIDTREFKRFAFAIQVPDLNSLYRQTISRLEKYIVEIQKTKNEKFFSRYGSDGTGGVGELVYKPAGTGAKAELEQWKERIISEKETLFLFIHDEAHYQATFKSGDSTWKSGAADKWINDDTIRLSPNVVTLFVSATPYNLLTQNSQVPLDNFECWQSGEDDGPPASGGARYYGLKSYKENPGDGYTAKPGCITDDRDYEEAVGKRPMPSSADTGVKKVADRKALVRRDVLFDEYAAAMAKAARPNEQCGDGSFSPSAITQNMMQDLIDVSEDGKGIMILLRVNTKNAGWYLHMQLCAARNHLGLRSTFAVVLDVDETKRGGLRKCIDESMQDMMCSWQGCDRDGLILEAYSDLENLPCILILCEKGKMGDTFPPSLRYYDLRLRYANSCNSRATAEQDLGRGFRYVHESQQLRRPTIIVGPACLRELGLQSGARDRSLRRGASQTTR